MGGWVESTGVFKFFGDALTIIPTAHTLFKLTDDRI